MDKLTVKLSRHKKPFTDTLTEWQVDILLPSGIDVHAVGDTVADALLSMAAYLKRKGLDIR